MSEPIRTLHVDMEGGWGGSSRSLFELVSRLDRNAIAPVIVHRQEGPVTEMYTSIGVPTYHVPEIGSYVPRKRKPLKNLVASLPRLSRLGVAADKIAGIAREYDTQLVHLNYEGLFLLAGRLRKRLDIPMVGHSRAYLPANPWGRWLVRRLAASVDHMFFISTQEANRWADLQGKTHVGGDVLWNIARKSLPRTPFSDPPEFVYLGSIDQAKGTDRLLDIAAALERCGAPPAVIAVYGLARANPQFARDLENRSETEGLCSRIAFRGHVADVAPVLARAAALIRPSREGDPWGRDLIEATAAGVPVLATGTFDGVVQHRRNGLLFESFNADAMANSLVELLENHERWSAMSEAGMHIGREKFGGVQQVARFTAVARELTARSG